MQPTLDVSLSPSQNGKAKLIPAYGGDLVNLVCNEAERQELRERSRCLPSIQLSHRASCDLELLAIGAFSPLDRFMRISDYERVLGEMRLENGCLFPIPVTLPIQHKTFPRGVEQIGLRDSSNKFVALMSIEEIYPFDPLQEASLVLGTTDLRHPLLPEMMGWGDMYVSGSIQVFDLPDRYDFIELRLSPTQTRAKLELMGYDRVVAFQTRNPMHRIHEEITKRAAAEINSSLLIHPVVGLTKSDDVDYCTRVSTYLTLVDKYFDPDRTLLGLLPLAMRFAGPREALMHAIIRRNFGATHFIIGRDHAGPGKDSQGKPFYDSYAAQLMLSKYSHEIGVRPVEFKELVYLPNENRYEEVNKIAPNSLFYSISGSQVRDDYLANGIPLPEWFTRVETAQLLVQSHHRNRSKGE